MAKLSGGDPSLLRRLNVTAVLRSLYEAEELTLAELVKASEVSRPTVEEIAADLGEQGLVEEVVHPPHTPRPVGRPAKRYRFRPDAGHVAGLEIGALRALCLVADLRGEIVGRARVVLAPEMSAPERLAAALAVLDSTVRGFPNMRALGVGTIGVVAEGKVVRGDRLPGWTGVDLAVALGAGRTYPVLAGNDTKLATLAEHWRGVARGVDDVVYLMPGRSISFGLILGGKLHWGFHGAAGEFGGLRHLMADLATGVAAIVLTVDPQLVVIGDGGPPAGTLRAALERLCLFPVRVETSILGDESVALGAVRLALNRVESELFTVTA